MILLIEGSKIREVQLGRVPIGTNIPSSGGTTGDWGLIAGLFFLFYSFMHLAKRLGTYYTIL